ncbi:MAG: phospholipase D-like domain-containing protein, partial [Scytonema sp. PMC 1069.18]|nr:phospholipase D-like domain-containing protein [Scytonema sp. PMC 1069.18]
MKFLFNLIAFDKSHFKLFRNTVLILLLFLGGLILVNSFKPPSKETLLQPLPQDPAIKAYFNQNLAASYQDPYRHFTRKGDNLEQQIIDAINQAQETVDLAVMQFRLPKVAEALILAHQRGVRVRVVIDNQYNNTLAEFTTEKVARMNQYEKQAYEELKRYPADALAMLRSSKIEIKDDTSEGATKGSGLMHHKFIVVDGKTTIVTSGNLTTSDLHGDFSNFESRGNSNNM